MRRIAGIALVVIAGCGDANSGGSGERSNVPSGAQAETDQGSDDQGSRAPTAAPTSNTVAGDTTPAATPTPTAAPTAAAGGTAVLNTFSKVWVSGDQKGPDQLDRITGAGTMDAAFAWDKITYRDDPSRVNLLTIYTRSENKANGDGSHMQGGFALATLTAKGVVLGPEINLPNLEGERTFMRPIGGFTKNHVVIIGASEDNGVNNNPQPVMFVADKYSGRLVRIPNSTRSDIYKPTNLIQQALRNGVSVNDPNSQRGPHTIQQLNDNTFIVGMQYNNHAQEAFSVTVNDDATVKMNWLQRYSDHAQHCRPQVALEPGSNVGYIAAVEADNQPAEIGFRVSAFDVNTGAKLKSTIPVRSDPQNNKYVSEPVMSILNDKLAITYGMSSQVRRGGAAGNNDGHAGGKKVDAAILLSKSDLSPIGTSTLGVGQYGRHGSSFTTAYGPNGEPALAVISGSSTGTGAGYIQMFPLKADGTLGLKDAAKAYPVSLFSDVANVQARGKRNPNNQARGFINGIGNIPNPGYTEDPAKAANSFMPEVKAFSFSTVTGYSGPDAMARGKKNSIFLSLVPASWRAGLATVPGKPTETPGTNPDGTGPALRTNATPTDTSGDNVTPGAGSEALPNADDANPTRRADTAPTGCATAPGSTSGAGALLVAAALGLGLARRSRRGRVIENRAGDRS